MTVAGVGFSLALPAVTKAVVGGVAMQHIGKASGAFGTMRQLGAAFGVAIVVAVFAAAGSYGAAHAFSDGFGPAIGAAAGLAFVGAVAALAAPLGDPGPRGRAGRRGISHLTIGLWRLGRGLDQPDQVPLRVCELTELDFGPGDGLRAEHALSTKLFGLGEGGLNIRDLDVRGSTSSCPIRSTPG